MIYDEECDGTLLLRLFKHDRGMKLSRLELAYEYGATAKLSANKISHFEPLMCGIWSAQ